ncbi:hypothetical protein A2Y83_02285 [Candidatus Falkowbacteria bacterium RBG_13_39_14]|uniref:PEP-utilising enzyme mobile domain-containing protein n=1 Tax=Candidatus Falkowbacteria bacterium RBG_13_39_14 TaxID=1797985 RepID=A0A1F5S3H6_9BACT|nr:MAG: hypothetical protein A2Y83_02285 [Candidatus Falkowbacteria bacterium RBG_13_39_14]
MDFFKFIRINNLHPSLKRHICLFTLSGGARAYTIKMRKEFGFSYEIVAGISKGDEMISIFNDKLVALKTEKLIEKILRDKNYYKEKIFAPANEIQSAVLENIKKIEKRADDSEYYLEKIMEISVQTYTALGMYSCFLRFFKEEQKKIPMKIVNRLGNDRNRIAEVYPKIEILIKSAVNKLGKRDGFDGDLLRYFTIDEMKKFLIDKRYFNQKKKILEQRRENYLYLFFEKSNQEYVISDKKIISKIEDYFKEDVSDSKTIKGQTAYKGKTKGRVYKCSSLSEPSGEFILVSAMTHPQDIPLIKKSLAVITDEGSILCHAAIICRELKKPCITGTKIATQILKDGDLIEVDAEKGFIKILK